MLKKTLVSLIALLAITTSCLADDLADIRAEVAKRHDEAVKRLQDWIAIPSIAAENLNYPKGAEYMAQLARDAGFQNVTVLSTDGKPGVYATLDAGAKKTVGLYFMYDVKQFDPAEWSSPPLEARIVDKAGVGKVIMGRGAVNQKGPEAAFLAALHAIRGAGKKMVLVVKCRPRGLRDRERVLRDAARTLSGSGGPAGSVSPCCPRACRAAAAPPSCASGRCGSR